VFRNNKKDIMMFESIEIRKVKNGVVVTLRNQTEDEEYVYDTDRKALKFIKEMLDARATEIKTS
jgi:hypothetical protein